MTCCFSSIAFSSVALFHKPCLLLVELAFEVNRLFNKLQQHIELGVDRRLGERTVTLCAGGDAGVRWACGRRVVLADLTFGDRRHVQPAGLARRELSDHERRGLDSCALSRDLPSVYSPSTRELAPRVGSVPDLAVIPLQI